MDWGEQEMEVVWNIKTEWLDLYNRKTAETLFKKYRRQYIAKLGRHPLDNTEIDAFAKSTYGIKYKGSYAQDENF